MLIPTILVALLHFGSPENVVSFDSFIFQLVNPSCPHYCPTGGVWGEWVITKYCDDYCGSCSQQTRTRRCVSQAYGCECSGESVITESCGIGVCPSPRAACCPPYKQMVIDGRQACGPQTISQDKPEPPCQNTCCPKEGIWSEWTAISACNDTCGMCGSQRVRRICLSESYGCPCSGPVEQDALCADALCLFPRRTCCPGYIKSLKGQRFYCGLITPTPAVVPAKTDCCPPGGIGLWNEWSEWSECSAKCGGCGKRKMTRTCASEAFGCPCKGRAELEEYCNQQPCAEEAKCCPPFYFGKSSRGNDVCLLAGN
ncbi:hypothetical protein QR680_016080 [Steinernema hermaphroditum]|uniref:Uncharacterized protein n=1 Tax=Steinernema hermaphroditum TaxID=289476 RepID=A0AA39LLU8_9BILA|nr:hypothetical protein QR680_016080 [Steinernema hermaphroditum]